MTTLTARFMLLFTLPVFTLTALALSLGQVLPYAGEIRYILFGDRGTAGVYTMDVLRGLALELIAPYTVITIEWSPNNQYVTTTGPEGTHITTLNSGRVNQLFDMRISPVWSPDGTRIAFEGYDDYVDSEFSIYLANGDGSEVTLLLPDETGDFRQPTFSPDGTQLAFTHNRDLYVYRFADESVVRLTATPYITELQTIWSPDSQHIAFLWVGTAPHNLLSVIDADGHNRLDLTTSIDFSIEGTTWSPDSTRLGFLIREGSNAVIFTASLDDPMPRQIHEPYPQLYVSILGWASTSDVLSVAWGELVVDTIHWYRDEINVLTGALIQQTPHSLALVSPDEQFFAYVSESILCIENRTTGDQRCHAIGDGEAWNLRWLP